jgi:hypothetical protein
MVRQIQSCPGVLHGKDGIAGGLKGGDDGLMRLPGCNWMVVDGTIEEACGEVPQAWLPCARTWGEGWRTAVISGWSRGPLV